MKKHHHLAWGEKEASIIQDIVKKLEKFFGDLKFEIPEDIQVFPPVEKSHYNILITTGTARNGRKPGFLFMRKEIERILGFKIGKFDISAGKIIVNLSELLNPAHDPTADNRHRAKIRIKSVEESKPKGMLENLIMLEQDISTEEIETSIPILEAEIPIESQKDYHPPRTNAFFDSLKKDLLRFDYSNQIKVKSFQEKSDIAMVKIPANKDYLNSLLFFLEKKEYQVWMTYGVILITNKRSLLKEVDGYEQGHRLAYKISTFTWEIKKYMISNRILGGIINHPILIAYHKLREKLVLELSDTNSEIKNSLLLKFFEKRKLLKAERKENQIIVTLNLKLLFE